MMDNAVREKSYRFAVRLVKLCRFLKNEKKEHIMSRQLLRSGTSVGANVAEAQHAQSRQDFLAKLNIALKEAAETDYWLRLLYETEYLTERQFKSIYEDCDEVESLLVSIVKSVKG